MSPGAHPGHGFGWSNPGILRAGIGDFCGFSFENWESGRDLIWEF